MALIHRRRQVAAQVAAISLLLFLVAPLALASTSKDEPGPFDPLTDGERKTAERIASSDPRVHELLGGGKIRHVYTEFIAVKPEGDAAAKAGREPEIGRHAEVVYYRFDGDVGVRALVDLRRGAAVHVVKADSATIPLTRDDAREAFQIALENGEVQGLLDGEAKSFQVMPSDLEGPLPHNTVRALLMHAFSDSDPCWRHRCVHLFFQRRDAYLVDSVVVDLTYPRAHIQRGIIK